MVMNDTNNDFYSIAIVSLFFVQLVQLVSSHESNPLK